MSQLSIIIVASSTDAALESTITSVLEHQPFSAEIFVAHDGSYEDPYDLGDEVQYIIVPGAASWMQLANAAASEVTTPYMHFLAAGVEVASDWADAALQRLQDTEVAMVCPVVLNQAAPTRVLSAGQVWTRGGGLKLVANGDSFTASNVAGQRPVGPTEVAAFFATDAWQAAGGFDETTSQEAASIDLALRIRAAGGQCAIESQSSVVAAAELFNYTGDTAGKVYQRQRVFRRHAASGLLHKIASFAQFASAPAAYLRAWRETPTGIHNSFATSVETPDVIQMPTKTASAPLRRAA